MKINSFDNSQSFKMAWHTNHSKKIAAKIISGLPLQQQKPAIKLFKTINTKSKNHNTFIYYDTLVAYPNDSSEGTRIIVKFKNKSLFGKGNFLNKLQEFLKLIKKDNETIKTIRKVSAGFQKKLSPYIDEPGKYFGILFSQADRKNLSNILARNSLTKKGEKEVSSFMKALPVFNKRAVEQEIRITGSPIFYVVGGRANLLDREKRIYEKVRLDELSIKDTISGIDSALKKEFVLHETSIKKMNLDSKTRFTDLETGKPFTIIDRIRKFFGGKTKEEINNIEKQL